ncbi:MAG TPA: hypothetical protein VKS19_01300 [Verrucomicrobiae bacterium]|nr:hypothetical protein [Verrucomicrobiae bacterium]
MKTIVLMAVTALALVGCAEQRQAKFEGFPVLPPIANADPSVRHEVMVTVPTRFFIERTSSTVSFWVDSRSFVRTNISVGTNMLVCFQDELMTRDGDAWTNISGTQLNGGLGRDFGEATLDTAAHLMPTNNSDFKMTVQIFETDIPPQHLWDPYSEKFRILWTGDLAPVGATPSDRY